jgi:hypothetical protein
LPGYGLQGNRVLGKMGVSYKTIRFVQNYRPIRLYSTSSGKNLAKLEFDALEDIIMYSLFSRKYDSNYSYLHHMIILLLENSFDKSLITAKDLSLLKNDIKEYPE